MRIILSSVQPQDTSYKWINNLPTLNESVLDAEATDIICEDFLSTFEINEQKELVKKITSKMRLGCSLTISEVDLNLITKRLYVEEINIDEFNAMLYKTTKRKSILSCDKIVENIPRNIQVTNKHYAYNECKIILKCRREK